MPKVTVLPHESICPNGAEFEVEEGANLARSLVKNGVNIEHACEYSCACTTCHCYITKGMSSLNEPDEEEEDLLDQAWGLKSNSRLSCQTVIGKEDIEVEIPKYTINHAREAF
ncbi:MAG: ISC system 2Fe-2S type ferredoxin [Burkholderiales bacterium]|nr:ISC system 2Fe-2S type ferredoxin [Burkholderiales bacterium]